jgi:hypothetical protein
LSRSAQTTEKHVSRDNTARQLYLLVNPNEPQRPPPPIADRRPSGAGILGALLLSLLLWGGLIWIAALIVGAFSR